MMRRLSFQPGLELRGRKFKGLRGFAGKPLHPPLTDATVGAYTIGPSLSSSPSSSATRRGRVISTRLVGG
jgi:hypothetical protein